MTTVRVATCQVSPVIGNYKRNLQQVKQSLSDANGLGAEIIVLPELPVSGYAFDNINEARALSENIDGETVSSYISASFNGTTIIGGFCEKGTDGEIYNSAAVVENGRIIDIYRKVHLWGKEQIFFTAGQDPAPVVSTQYGQIGVGICYDIEFPELSRDLTLRGAEILAFPTNWPKSETPAGERPNLHTIAMATARLNRVYVAVSDRSGTERGHEYMGASIVASPDGWSIANSEDNSEFRTIVADCDLDIARDKHLGEMNDILLDRRPELYLKR